MQSPAPARLHRACAALLAACAAFLLGFAPPAAASTAGANGWIHVMLTTAASPSNPNPTRYNRVDFLDPTSGADARPTFDMGTASGYNGASDAIVYGADGNAIAGNVGQQQTGLVRWSGARLGSATNLFGAFGASTAFYPGTPFASNLCASTSQVVAALPDGTFLWRRLDGPFHASTLLFPSQVCTTGYQGDYTGEQSSAFYVTTPQNEVLRTYTNFVTGGAASPSAFTFSGRWFPSADPNVLWQWQNGQSYAPPGGTPSEPYGLYRLDLAKGTRTLLRAIPSLEAPSDVSTDGATAIFSDSGATGDLVRRDIATGAQTPVLTTAQAGGRTGYPIFSPDGQQIAFIRYSGSTYDVSVVGIDGKGFKVLRSYPTSDAVVNIGWKPSAGLNLTVDGGALPGDTFELDLDVQNGLPDPVTGLTYDSSAQLAGLVFNTAPFAPEQRLGVTTIGGPAPGLLSQIGGGGHARHQWLLGVDHPGSALVRAKVQGTAANGGPLSATSEILSVTATNRDLTRGEEMATVTGAYAMLQEQLGEIINQRLSETADAIEQTIGKRATKSQRKKLASTTRTERSLARAASLPDDALSWLPSGGSKDSKAAAAFLIASNRAANKVIKERLGKLADKTFKVPFDYWRAQLVGDPETTIPVGEALYTEGAYWAQKGGEAATSFAGAAYQLATDPARQHEVGVAAVAAAQKFKAKAAEVAAATPGALRKVRDRYRKDPIGSAKAAGTIFGTVQAELGLGAAEVALTPSKAGIVQGVEKTGEALRTFWKSSGSITETRRTLTAMSTVEKVVAKAIPAADDLPTAASLGMPERDQQLWSQLVQQIEGSTKAKYGVDVNVQMSFRPRNLYSAEIKDGVGKNFFIKKAKAGDDIDLMLGMHESGLGKAAIYNPKRPANFKDLPAELQQKLDDRIKDMRAGYKEWYDPKSAVGKARRKGGFTGTATVGTEKAGANSAIKIKMRLRGKTKGGTTVMEYDELIVDGRTIVKRGTKRRPVVSDYDGNAILQVGGAELPPKVRGYIELEAMRLQRELGATKGVAVSFHGWTKNGFDVPGSVYRHLYKFLLEGLDEKGKAIALKRYVEKYQQPGDDFEALLKAYQTNDYVVKVTRTGATAGYGY